MSGGVAFAAVLTQMAKTLKRLTDEELEEVASGSTQLMLVPKGSKIVFPLDLPALAAEIRELGSPDEIVKLLDQDSRLNAANLKKLAGELNISVPPTVKAKGPLQLHIAQSAAAHWQRTRGRL